MRCPYPDDTRHDETPSAIGGSLYRPWQLSSVDMHVSQLWRYPVKSMIGERIDSAEFNRDGMIGDRTWATRDLVRGGIRGAKQLGQLMQFRAATSDDGSITITTPSGSHIDLNEENADELLSEALNHAVHLERLKPADDLDHYRRGAPDHDDLMTQLRAIFGRSDDEPIPDFGSFPDDIRKVIAEFESPPGTYYDMYPLLVISEQSLQHLRSELPDAAVDVRRFRPSLVIDCGELYTSDTTLPELSWVGRRARIGTAVVEFTMACPRCVMVTREIDEHVPADRSVLRHIVRELNQNLGVYASIVEPGIVDLNDDFVLID